MPSARGLWPVAICCGLVLTVAGCGLLRKRPVRRDEGVVREMLDGRRPIGQITLLDQEHGFVLLRSPLADTLREGSLLVAKDQAGNTTGKLKVSPEKKKSFLAADITEGSPKSGDVVLVPSDRKLVSTAPPPEAGKPAPVGAPGALDVPPPPVAGPGTPDGALPPLGQPSGPAEVLPEISEPPEPPR